MSGANAIIAIICERVREAAANERLTIQYNIKHPEWKTKLLPLIPKPVILRQLRYVHPFQYIGDQSKGGCHVFRLPFFKYAIYVKLDKDIKNIISFHFDEVPIEPKHLNEYPVATISEDRLQVILVKNKHESYLPIALGSTVLKLYPHTVYRDADGTEYVDSKYLLLELAQPYLLQQELLYKLNEVSGLADVLNIELKDTNFLTWVDDDKTMQTYSLLADAANAHPELPWLSELCLDIILANPDLQTAMLNYNSTLHPSVFPAFKKVDTTSADAQVLLTDVFSTNPTKNKPGV